MKLLILTLALASTVLADQTFYNLKTTWGPNPVPGFGYFNEQPRTTTEADAAGFTQIGNCDENDEFIGNVYIPPDGTEFALIFDVNGFIAGMHSIVPADKTYDDKYYKFSTSDWYRAVKSDDGTVMSYVTTAYFIEPSRICSEGRTQEEFDVQGTLGDGLLILKGTETVSMPLTEDAAVADPMWYKHFCFINMGNHFFTMDPSIDADAATGCDTAVPLQMVYHDNILNAFVWQHVADIPGDRFETPNELAINSIVDNPPTCLLAQVSEPGQRTMHVYVRTYLDVCIFDKEQ